MKTKRYFFNNLIVFESFKAIKTIKWLKNRIFNNLIVFETFKTIKTIKLLKNQFFLII